MKSPSVMPFILKAIGKFRWWVGAQVVIALIWAVDLSFRPYLVKIMLDRMTDLDPALAYDRLLVPGIVYISMSATIVLIFRFYDYVWLNLNPPLRRYLALKIMKRMLRQSHHFYQHNLIGALSNKIKDVMTGVPDILKMLIDTFISQIVAILIAVGTMSTVSFWFAGALVVWIVIFAIGSIKLSSIGRRYSDESAEMRSNVIGMIADTLGNMMSIRLFTGRLQEKVQLTDMFNAYVQTDQQRDWFFMKLFGFQGGTFVIYQGICLLWLIKGFSNGTVTAGDFALVLTINISIVDCLWSLSRDVDKATELAGNINRGLQLLLMPPDIKDLPSAPALVVTQGEIVFDAVQFVYRGAEPFFNNKSVRILPRQKVGLVGYSGGGKSTFVNLILRFFDISAGHIYIDGQDIANVTQDSLRAAIGVIPQDPTLFHRTIMENIRYARPDATDAEVIEAAKQAHAHEFIMAMPHGYDSYAGERGSKLSGGQRQRIAIARAFLKNAPILILDEATSQLDPITERDIQATFWSLMQDKTTLVVAHRLSTLQHMDRILVFQQGKIVQDGTHSQLLEQDGLYRVLWHVHSDGIVPEKKTREV
jgi:ATP-binding cassette, subfamily B, bacterial